MTARVAIVTGAGRGIGAATARALAADGKAVACLDIDLSAARKVAEENAALVGGRAAAVECDVSIRANVEAAVATVEKTLGPVDILINNAGYGGPFQRIDEVSDEEWERVISTNLRSVFFFARVLLPKMKAAGWGRIVNIASIQGLYGAARSSTYVASKHAMIGYTRAIAAEWGEYGITCNAICPGYVDTTMGVQPDRIEGHLARVIERTPVGRVAHPDEIGAIALQFVGEKSGYINGAALVIDGGITAHLGLS
ncbi:MAG: SDR family oxidoreductase [Polyangiaceae bacterium]|nr:SDR family oxidoreductase [Polyangiaceae bacterium]